MQGCTEFEKEKGTANRKKKYNCFFIFSSCNWTCMYLTLQWPGSFCIVCLYILYITVLVNFTQDSIAVCLKSYEATDIDIIASFKISCDLCLSCYFCWWPVFFFPVLPQGINNKTICKIPHTVQNWTIHGLWWGIQWLLFPFPLIWKWTLHWSILYFLLLFLTLLFISLFGNFQMTFRPIRTGHCCDCWLIYHSHLQVKILHVSTVCLFVLLFMYLIDWRIKKLIIKCNMFMFRKLSLNSLSCGHRS